jgi:hypothetical protein
MGWCVIIWIAAAVLINVKQTDAVGQKLHCYSDFRDYDFLEEDNKVFPSKQASRAGISSP